MRPLRGERDAKRSQLNDEFQESGGQLMLEMKPSVRGRRYGPRGPSAGIKMTFTRYGEPP